jgi:hypothetical protein
LAGKETIDKIGVRFAAPDKDTPWSYPLTNRSKEKQQEFQKSHFAARSNFYGNPVAV